MITEPVGRILAFPPCSEKEVPLPGGTCEQSSDGGTAQAVLIGLWGTVLSSESRTSEAEAL